MEDKEEKTERPRSPEEIIQEDSFIDMYIRQGLSIHKIASLLGVRRETIWKWKKCPEVQERMRMARARLKRGIDVVEKPRRGRPSRVFADFDAKLPQAVAALVATGTVSGAASRLGISRDKFSEWRKHPAFQAALERAGNGILTKALTQIESDCIAAARTPYARL
jgi:transposase-like protein